MLNKSMKKMFLGTCYSCVKGDYVHEKCLCKSF